MQAYVEGEDDIVVGDLLTCKLIVTYPRLKKGEQSGYVHSQSYPYLRRDTWYLIITDEQLGGIAAVEKLPINEDVYEKEYKERLYRAGPIKFTAILANDSYKGLDQYVVHSIVVLERSKTRQEFKYQKIDKWLCQDTAMFWKRDPADYDTDDENEEVEAFVDDEQEIDELIRVLQNSNLTNAHHDLIVNKYQVKQEDVLSSWHLKDYLPDNCRKIILYRQLEKQ